MPPDTPVKSAGNAVLHQVNGGHFVSDRREGEDLGDKRHYIGQDLRAPG